MATKVEQAADNLRTLERAAAYCAKVGAGTNLKAATLVATVALADAKEAAK